MEPNSRRHILLGGFLVSAFAAVSRVLGFKGATNGPVIGTDTNGDEILEFIKQSRDMKNYVTQIESHREKYFVELQKRFPEVHDELQNRFHNEHWNLYHKEIISSYYKDAKAVITSEDATAILAFFNSSAGQSYLKWKDVIQGPNSEVYKTVQTFTKEFSRHTTAALDKKYPRDGKKV